MSLDAAPSAIVLTPQQVATYFQCSKGHVYRLISSGALPSVDISTPGSAKARHRILLEDVEAYSRTPRA